MVKGFGSIHGTTVALHKFHHYVPKLVSARSVVLANSVILIVQMNHASSKASRRLLAKSTTRLGTVLDLMTMTCASAEPYLTLHVKHFVNQIPMEWRAGFLSHLSQA